MAKIIGTSGNDSLKGTTENDVIKGLAGKDTLEGNLGNDLLDGGSGADVLKGETGNDIYIIDNENDLVVESINGGTDQVKSSVSYTLKTNVENLVMTGNFYVNGTGNSQENTLTGNNKNNILIGNAGNDKLKGNNGYDTLVGGAGNDTLTGGTGNDKFVLNSPYSEGVETIADLIPGQDKIKINASLFGGGLNEGPLVSEQFVKGTSAKDGGDRFIYNSSTGALFFDSDGNGSTAQIKIAQLSEKPNLQAQNILIFTPNELQQVESWVYRLQGLNGNELELAEIIAYPADLAVIDYSSNGGENGEFSSSEIESLKNSGKIVLAYMPIGAADAGRFYDNNPNDDSPFSNPQGDQLLGNENENFPGTFFVKYWYQDWQNIIFGDNDLPDWLATANENNYLERILAAGFDGVYLDDIDGYQQFNPDGDNSRPTAALEMVLFIKEISDWAKDKSPGFFVVPQNAENVFNDAFYNLDDNSDDQLDGEDGLIVEENNVLYLDADEDGVGDISLAEIDANSNGVLVLAEIEDAYFDAINALGSEDFFFKGNNEENNSFVDTLLNSPSRINDFKFTADNYLKYAERDKPIFNVEYLTDNNSTGIQQYRDVVGNKFEFTNPNITSQGTAPAFTNFELHSLNVIPFNAPSRGLDALPVEPTVIQ